MKVVQIDDVRRIQGLEHRSGTFFSRTMAQGEPGTAGNFKFSLSENGTDHYGPRHRHNFEQFRYVLEGEMDFDRDGTLKPGMLGYFPEGVRYGPQINKSPTVTAIIQFGGASGSGYLQPKEVRAGMQALQKIGEFKDGVFRRHEGVPGKRNMEAYEAIWEHVTQRTLIYPKPRYSQPIITNPANYAWMPIAAGVAEKLCGVFTERRSSAGFLKLDPGAAHEVEGRGIYFILCGEGSAGSDRYSCFTTVFLETDEHATLNATTATEILCYGLPDLSDLSDSAFTPAREAAE
jgi:mannose-6-phosphate isomerase-like protein (cupin superfamily)